MARARGRRISDVTQVRPIDVLVVEDDGDTRELFVELLRRAGCAVRALATSEDALREVRVAAPEIVLTDLALAEGGSGLSLAVRLRASPATAGIGLIAVSGAVEPEWATVQPFDAYLRKPIDYDVLVDLVLTLADALRTRGSPEVLSETTSRRGE